MRWEVGLLTGDGRTGACVCGRRWLVSSSWSRIWVLLVLGNKRTRDSVKAILNYSTAFTQLNFLRRGQPNLNRTCRDVRNTQPDDKIQKKNQHIIVTLNMTQKSSGTECRRFKSIPTKDKATKKSRLVTVAIKRMLE